MDRPVKIVVVEDHPLVRIGLKTLFSKSEDKVLVVGEVGSSAEFFKILENAEADLVLLDIMLPDETGVEIASKLKKSHPDLKILILSAETDEDKILQLLNIGIDGFVSKSISSNELIEAIVCVAEGSEYYGKEISKIIRDLSIAKNNQTEKLTERESDIVALCSQGYVAKEIASKLNISIDTVNTHKYNIFKKLGINNSVELVRYAIKHGIISL